MNRKAVIWIGIFVGSTAGSLIPSLWGGDIFFSFSAIFFSTVGSIFGIWAAFKVTE